MEQALASSRMAKVLPPIAGFMVAAVVAFSASLPPSHYVSWSGLIASAFERLFAVSLACAMSVSALCAVISRRIYIDSHRVLVQTSRAAIWLAPLALLIRANSAWTLAAVAAFAVLATPALPWVEKPAANPEDSLLSSLRPDNLPLFPKSSLPISVAAALSAQIGTVALFAGHPFTGSLLAGAAFVAWTWSSLARTSHSDALSQSHSLPVAAVAILFTVAGLIPYLRGATGFGLGSSHQYASHSLPRGHKAPQGVPVNVSGDSAARADNGNAGIILWPTTEIHTKLIAPVPVDFNSQLTGGRKTSPLVIPFNGVYWFYKAPDIRPPTTSRQAQASPDAVEIRSTDRRPLSIEAHDYLGNLFDLSCCSRIQIAIRNADRYPDTVSLELILVDTSLATKPSESLGSTMVKSTQPWHIYEHGQPVSETLNFAIPARGSLHRFNEVKIAFRLDRARADAGARIAIDHLVLVPRGL